MNLPSANLPSGGTPITLFTPAVNYFSLNSGLPLELNFNLSMFPDYLMYTPLYDLYRIVKVEVEFRPNIDVRNNVSNTSTMGTTYQTAVGRIPWYCWVNLSDGATNLDNTTFKSVNNLHTWYYDETYKLHFWPKPDMTLELAAGTGQTGAGVSDGGNWIDTAYPTVQHDGIAIQLGANNTGVTKLATDNSVVNMWVKMWVEFKFNE